VDIDTLFFIVSMIEVFAREMLSSKSIFSRILWNSSIASALASEEKGTNTVHA
jgi:hypothetical protein